VAREALFDLAVNRAAGYLERLGVLEASREARRARLEPWYLRTRFAYRIPLETILDRLEGYPGPGHYWAGGKGGGWRWGKNPHP
jgi:hypothetical protein